MKRSRQSDSQAFADLLVLLPPWVTVILGVIAYFVIQWLPNVVTGMLHEPLIENAPLFGVLAFLFFAAAAIIGAFRRFTNRRLLDKQRGPESLRSMDPKEFELLVAEAYKRQGYVVDYSVHSGPDGGVDVVLRKNGRTSLVQCKRWKTWSVGVAIVREMFGLLHHEGADEVIVVTTGEFTDEAKAFAKGKAMQLINGGKLWQMVQGVQSSRPTTQEPSTSPPLGGIPACPKCGGEMTMRLAKKGSRAGQNFWGCLGYPSCSGTL